MTTGRINQVAILHDVARAARGPRERSRGGRGRHAGDRSFSWGTRRGDRPPVHCMHRVREHSAPPRATRPMTAGWHARVASLSSGALCKAPDGGLNLSGGSVPVGRVGNARTARGHIEAPFELTTSEEDCQSTVRWTSTEPADGDNPNTTHTPARSRGPTPPSQPHPASPWVKRANGGDGRRRPNTARHDELT